MAYGDFKDLPKKKQSQISSSENMKTLFLKIIRCKLV